MSAKATWAQIVQDYINERKRRQEQARTDPEPPHRTESDAFVEAQEWFTGTDPEETP